MALPRFPVSRTRRGCLRQTVGFSALWFVRSVTGRQDGRSRRRCPSRSLAETTHRSQTLSPRIRTWWHSPAGRSSTCYGNHNGQPASLRVTPQLPRGNARPFPIAQSAERHIQIPRQSLAQHSAGKARRHEPMRGRTRPTTLVSTSYDLTIPMFLGNRFLHACHTGCARAGWVIRDAKVRPDVPKLHWLFRCRWLERPSERIDWSIHVCRRPTGPQRH